MKMENEQANGKHITITENWKVSENLVMESRLVNGNITIGKAS